MNTTTADARSAPVIDQPQARQLRGSGDDKMLAGVAGGMVRYLNADVTLVRVIIAALVLFTGAGVALYVAAWLLIPEDGVDRRPPGPHPLTRTMTRTRTEKDGPRLPPPVGRRWEL